MYAIKRELKLNKFETLRSPTIQCSLDDEIARDIPRFLELGIRCFLVVLAGGFGEIEERFLTDGAF